MAVSTQPGNTALDVTPNGPASCATARANPISPCLEAVYALPERSAFSPAVELVNTNRPKPRLHMPPTVSRASSNGPSRLMRIVSRHTAGACSPPVRAPIITRAPPADSSNAASRPIPRPPPVTSATRPFIALPRSARRAAEHHSILHHEADVKQLLYVGERIVGHGDQIRVCPRRDNAQIVALPEQLRRARGCGLNRLHRRHAEFNHAAELLCDGFGPRVSTDIGTE